MFPREVLRDHIGSYRTQSLFLESNKSRLDPIMTLKELDWEWKGRLLPSLKKMYLDLADPTEYSVAIEVFGSWTHWNRILENKLIRTEIHKWREELEIKLRAEGIKALRATAKEEGSKGTAAAKFLADRGWDKRKAGAPSKEETVRERKVQAAVHNDLEEDAERIGMTKH